MATSEYINTGGVTCICMTTAIIMMMALAAWQICTGHRLVMNALIGIAQRHVRYVLRYVIFETYVRIWHEYVIFFLAPLIDVRRTKIYTVI